MAALARQRHLRKRPDAGRGRPRNGFTLIEIVVVVIIIGLLAGIVTPRLMGHVGTSRSKAARLQLDDLVAALELYRLEVGAYPSSDQGLEALTEKPSDVAAWHGPYIRRTTLRIDPWGRPYHYRVPGNYGAFDLYSFGADGLQGGDGENADIASWE